MRRAARKAPETVEWDTFTTADLKDLEETRVLEETAEAREAQWWRAERGRELEEDLDYGFFDDAEGGRNFFALDDDLDDHFWMEEAFYG